MKSRKYSDGSITHIADLNRMIHEPARLMILSCLYVVKSMEFIILERQTGLTRGNLSSHLTKLEKSGYVTVEKEFVDKIPRTLLSLTAEGRRAFRLYRKRMKRVLDDLRD